MPLHPKIAREQDIAVLARGLQRVNRTAGTQRTSNAGTWFIPDGTFDENGIPTGSGVVIGPQANDFDGIAHRNPDGTLKPLVDTSAIDDKLNSAQEDIDDLNQSLVQVDETLVDVNQTLEDNRKTIAEAQEVANSALSAAASANDNAQAAHDAADAAKTTASAAKTAADNAQAAASSAQTAARAAKDAADSAKSIADSATQNVANLAEITGRVIYSSSAPTGDDRNGNNLWIDSNGQPHRWNGSAWVLVTDSRITSAANAANQANSAAQSAQNMAQSAQTAANDAKTAAQNAQTAASSAQSAANTAKNAASDAKITASEAKSVASSAQSAATQAQATATAANQAATSAQTAANAAKQVADAATSDLAELAGITGRVIYSSSQPTGSDRNENNLWINSSNGQPYRWSGSSWVLVTDSRITSAANAANTANTNAQNAQTAADNAQSTASKANTAAQNAAAIANRAEAAAKNAQTTANGKNKIFTQSSEPSHSGLVPGDQWNVTNSSGQVTSNRVWNGSSFVEHKLYLSSLAVPSSVGTTLIQNNAITTGKVAANAINASKIAADAVTADKIAANAVTADSIASNAVGTNELAANAVTTAKLNVTEDMTVKLLAAHKIEADEIDLNTLNGVTINGMVINGGEVSVGNADNRIHIHNNADISNIDFLRNGSEIAKMYFIYEQSRKATVFVISSGQEQITNRSYIGGAQPDPDAPNGWTISSGHNVRILPQHALDMFGETCSMQFTNAVNVSTGRMTLRTSGGKIYLGDNTDTPINTLARCRAQTYDNNANRFEFDMKQFRTVAGNVSLFASATGANGTHGIKVNATGLYAICGQINVNEVNGGSGEIDIRRTPKGASGWSSVMSTGFVVEPASFASGWTLVTIPWQYVYLNSSDVVTLGFTETWAKKVGGYTMMSIRPVAL